jgi:hypothetical protein
MPAAQPLRAAAPGGAPDLSAATVKDAPHLVLVTPAAVPYDPSAPADVRRQSFGQRLRAARERRGITLHQIADSTKVSVSLLAALERNDVSRWPKGIFRRSFFREYVLAIGLPPEPLVTDFLQLFPDGESHPALTAPTEAADGGSFRLTLAPSPGIPRERLLAVSIELILVLVLAAAVVWWIGGVFGGAAVIGLCYYSRLIAAVRSRRSRRPPRDLAP